MDDNERLLQKKCEKLVSQHVYVCQSYLVDEMLRTENVTTRDTIFSYDDISNTYTYRDESDLKYDYKDEWKVYSAAIDDTLTTFLDYLMLKEEKVFLEAAKSDVTLDEAPLKETYPDRWDEWEEIESARTNIWLSERNEEDIDDFADYLEYIEQVDEDNLREERDIFEWWVVSDWLQHYLEEMGCPFLDNDYGTWWGRQTTGQQISADSEIAAIVKDYESKYGTLYDVS